MAGRDGDRAASSSTSRRTRTYWLPREHAACLTGSGVENLAPVALLTTVLGQHVPEVAEAFRRGGGVPYSAFLPEIHDVMDALWRPMYDDLLVPAILPLAPGLDRAADRRRPRRRRRLRHRQRAPRPRRRVPGSTFVGYDLDDRRSPEAEREPPRGA